MIFVTVGTQLPFDRLIRAVDEIAPDLNGEEIIAQTKGGAYVPRHIKQTGYLCTAEYSDTMRRARLIISHAGMGTIITGLMLNKPIIVVPRLFSLGEHRNEHQLATAKKMQELGMVHVAYDNRQLRDLLLTGNIRCLRHLDDKASDELIQSITDFIADNVSKERP